MTFTDMLMLLVVMFVLFLSFSEINSDSFKQNAGAISEAFNQAPSTSLLPGYSSVVDLSRSNINVESMGSQAGINTIEKNEKKTIDFAERKYKEDDDFKEKEAYIKDYEREERQEKLAFIKKKIDQKLKNDANQEKLKLIKKNINQKLKNDVNKGKLEIIERNKQVILRFPEKVTFQSGSAELNENIKLVIKRVRNIVKESPELKKIVVAGHTDNVPIYNEFFSSNWELSAARAVSVVHSLLETSQIDTKLVMAVGSADTEPIAPNTDSVNRAANRRVEIKLEF
ncbi:MAG: OmpA family protein [Rhodospirillaceae bacterium]|nr:OmpA family protein [Rhodospirillaceae bacterium]